ncbi:MAG TPA: hypothetical protein VKD90_09355 [Gemmataceae bacterium]|nr:hypothetical protein [Gemmataceae bacterium]
MPLFVSAARAIRFAAGASQAPWFSRGVRTVRSSLPSLASK